MKPDRKKENQGLKTQVSSNQSHDEEMKREKEKERETERSEEVERTEVYL